MTKHFFSKSKAAFSLIELSISLALIGLIVGGIAIGYALRSTANLQQVIIELRHYEYITNSFVEKYKSLPGDLIDISALPSTHHLIAGNGNGIIENQEALQFWLHLKAAGFLTQEFDGVSKFQPTSNNKIGGIPSSKFNEIAGYSVESEPTLGRVVIKLSGYSDTEDSLPLFTPAEVVKLEAIMDDKKPLEGSFRAFDGSNQPPGSCITASGNYNISNPNVACYIKYIFPDFKYLQPASTTSIECDGFPLGFSRKSDNATCLVGQEGHVIQVCNSASNGSWRNLNYLCNEARCTQNIYVGQAIKIHCPPFTQGFVTLKCNNYSQFQDEGASSSSNANICTANYNCINDTAQPLYRSLACPIGYGTDQDKWIQFCPAGGGEWQDLVKECTPLHCDNFHYLGELNPNPTNVTCPVGYQSAPAVLNENCVFTENGLNWRLTHLNCLPDYGNGTCALGDERTLKCPATQIGTVKQVCNKAGYYETIIDDCAPSMCDTYKVGQFKTSLEHSCPIGTTGNVMAVCDYIDPINSQEAAWKITYKYCQQIKCPSINDNQGNVASWPESNADTLVETNNCLSGTGPAKRYCRPDGNWAPPEQSCQ